MTDRRQLEWSPLPATRDVGWMGMPPEDPLLALPPAIAAAFKPLLALWNEEAHSEELERPLLRRVAAELELERERQIKGMVAAMNSFVAALYSGAL